MDGENADDETTTVACLAIADKRPPDRRPSGCAGIFYQLFDWNRSFAKKKRFPNKLLSSGSARNSSSKRFGAHDKLPAAAKFHLIADENCGGFPKTCKTGGRRMDIVPHKHEMRPASLVAKLMGLDSIPSVRKGNQARPSHSHANPEMDEKIVHAHSLCRKEKEDIVLEEGLLKNEPRPQKQRKMGQLDIQAMARFGQDSLHLKNVLSRSRKHLHHQKGNNHTKIPTMVKSPRVRTGRNASRLIDAATKILEPRLRVSSSRTNAITYSPFVRHKLNQHCPREETIIQPPALSTLLKCHSNQSDSFEIMLPCNNCGLPSGDTYLPQVKADQQSPYHSHASRWANLSPQKWPSHKLRSCTSMIEQDYDIPPEIERNQPVFFVSDSHDCIHTHAELQKEKRLFQSLGQQEWHFLSRPHEPEVPPQSSDSFSPLLRITNQMPAEGDKISSWSKLSSMQSGRLASAVSSATEIKEINSFNQRPNTYSGQKIIRKVDTVTLNQEMEQCTSKSHSKTPERKRRISAGSRAVENQPSPDSGKRCISKFDRHPSCNSSNSNSNKKFGSQGTIEICTEPLSVASQSPAKRKSKISLSKDKMRAAGERMVIMKEKTVHPTPAQPVPVSSDLLDALLKQKLKELTYQEEREHASAGAQSKTSKILQELISALATERHTSNSATATEISQKYELYHNSLDSSCDMILHHHDFRPDTITTEKAKKIMEDPSIRHLSGSDHVSPGSVLGASFSNSSWISSSQDDSSETILQHGLMEYIHYFPPPLEPATKHVIATDKGSTRDLIRRISIMLEDLGRRGSSFTAKKLSHMKEVILHSGLLLENGFETKSEGKEEFFICHFFKKLETFANAMWSNPRDAQLIKEAKDKTHLTGMLLDFAVEYLDSRFGNSSNLEFDLRRTLPLRITVHQLILGLNNEITRWANLAGKTPDELIEWELSQSTENWIDYEVEARSVCCDFEDHILKSLVEEIVMDMKSTWCRTKLVSPEK